ncbi:hypothetical protein M0804_002786 [Polistes exclamans]|nr:hypothetical protein M0804_002786 [Polistes exclamans]
MSNKLIILALLVGIIYSTCKWISIFFYYWFNEYFKTKKRIKSCEKFIKTVTIVSTRLMRVSATTPEKTDCGPNQIFDSCGLSCPRTCRNPSPTICTLVSVVTRRHRSFETFSIKNEIFEKRNINNCVAGCRCVDGFVRNNNNDCVLQKDC